MAEFHCCLFRDGIESRNGVQESMHLLKCWLEERCKWQFVKLSLCGPAVRSVCLCSIKEKTCQISKPNYQKSKSGPVCVEIHRRECWPTMQFLVIKKMYQPKWSFLSCSFLTSCLSEIELFDLLIFNSLHWEKNRKINKHLSFQTERFRFPLPDHFKFVGGHIYAHEKHL